MSGKIKIALCLSGEPRSSMFCFPYIYESFINLGHKYEVDVYIHSWKGFRALPLYNSKEFFIDDNKTPLFLKNKILTDFSFSDFLTNSLRFYNLNLMYYSNKASFDLIKNKNYDVYIRSRLDLLIESKFILDPVIHDIVNKNLDIFIPCNDLSNKENALDDQIWISNLNGMNYLANFVPYIFSNPEDFYKQYIYNNNITVSPEIILKQYLDNSNLNYASYALSNFRLIRKSDVTTDISIYYNFLDE
jgi:hypothetical protein